MRKSISPYQPKQYVRDILKGQAISLIGGVSAGFILASRVESLKILPGFFILFPGFLELQGAINATLAARIGSLVHIKGVEKADEIRDPQVKANFGAALILSVVTSLCLGISSLLLAFLILKRIVIKLILVSFLAGTIVSLSLIPLTLATSVWLYKKGYDPDNVMGPFLTSVTDFISVIVLIIIITIFT